VTSSFRIACFNAENFSLLLDRPYSRDELGALDDETYRRMNPSIYYPNKDRAKVAAIARMVVDGDWDVVGLCEVGGLETLETFNRLYLGGRYQAVLHEENSKRGIFVGALVKKDTFTWARASNVAGDFARNLLRLSLGLDGGGVEVFVVHLKSQFGSDWGIEHRIKEVRRLAGLVRPHRCIVMGDFNGIAIRGQAQFEYEPFLELGMVDVLETVGVPADHRRTHYHFGPEPHFTQLDYLFCTPDLGVLEAGVIEGEIPINRSQRNFLPSDHLMLWARVATKAPPTKQGPAAAPEPSAHSEPQRPKAGPGARMREWWRRWFP